MANSIKLDWGNQEIKYIAGTDVELTTEDRTETVILGNEEFENLIDDYRNSIGEKTFSELEDMILKLEVELENLNEIIEEKERIEEIERKRYFRSSY